jgi:hypothetical protein
MSHCNTWPWPNSDLDLVNPADNEAVHRARGCCDGGAEPWTPAPPVGEDWGRTPPPGGTMKVTRVETQGGVGFGGNRMCVSLMIEEGDADEAPLPIALSSEVRETLVRFLQGTATP